MSNPLLDTRSLPRFDELAPEQVLPALRELIAAHRQKLDELLESHTDPDFESLVLPLEQMEHELARVWSPVSPAADEEPLLFLVAISGVYS